LKIPHRVAHHSESLITAIIEHWGSLLGGQQLSEFLASHRLAFQVDALQSTRGGDS
jgi:hypothetical protein